MAPESNTPNTNTPIRQNVAVPKPDAGANVTIDSSAGGQLQLGFDPSVATPTRSGNDLSFDVEGGGKVTVKDFFAVGDESLPRCACLTARWWPATTFSPAPALI